MLQADVLCMTREPLRVLVLCTGNSARSQVAILAVSLRGEVIESTAAGFLVRNTAAINAAPAAVYAALTDKVGGWWDPVHTFSHDSHNLSVDAKPGGCFCERFPDGVVSSTRGHLRVTRQTPSAERRDRPLQEAALAGT